MIPNDFYGTKYIWWTGVVEDRTNDPLKIGNVRVRIHGLHSDSKTDIPTDALPWAQVLAPVNGIKTFASPREGDFVSGFFLDGQNGQIPVITGIYNGIEGTKFPVPDGTPQPPEGVVVRQVDEPLNPRMSWENIKSTMIDKMNNDLSSVCDVSSIVKIEMAQVKIATSSIIEEIKEAFRVFLLSLGADPTGEIRKAYQQLQMIYSRIKKIIKMIREELKFWKELVLDAIKTIKNIIEFITSLPEKFKKFVRDCIAKITGALKDGLNDLTKYIGGQISGGEDVNKIVATVTAAFTKLQTVTSSLDNSANSELSQISNPGGNGFTQSITNPTIESFAAANTTFNAVLSTFPSPKEIDRQSSYNSFSGEPGTLLTGP